MHVVCVYEFMCMCVFVYVCICVCAYLRGMYVRLRVCIVVGVCGTDAALRERRDQIPVLSAPPPPVSWVCPHYPVVVL